MIIGFKIQDNSYAVENMHFIKINPLESNHYPQRNSTMKKNIWILALIGLLWASMASAQDFTVAADGSGDHRLSHNR